MLSNIFSIPFIKVSFIISSFSLWVRDNGT
nr:MAG TPA: hypothetical protein [Bacteriophage sp.]DAI57822.1 MAG TPA: hypothetical protein [Caudoviricetes sp.]DAV54049.1 MAG TPA: hypothetical protein [Caudoviricetes sp.]